jgi:hypothetical protein
MIIPKTGIIGPSMGMKMNERRRIRFAMTQSTKWQWENPDGLQGCNLGRDRVLAKPSPSPKKH